MSLSRPPSARATRLAALALMLTAAPASGFAQEIVITDQTGREVVLDGPAERIVTIPIPMASTVIALDGGTERLVGMNPLSLTAIEEGILGRIFPQARDITDAVVTTGFMPNVEALAATDPDLVIQWGNQGNDIVDPLLNAGLQVLLVVYGEEANAREYMVNVANAIGRPERIEALVEWREEVQQDIAARVADIPDQERPRVLYLLRSLSDVTAGGGPGNYNNWYIELTGGAVAAAELTGNLSVNREQIAQWDPDVILLNSFEPELDVSWVHDDPILSLTAAAQAGRVYKMPLGGYRWDPPNQESPLTWMWLASLLHPDVFDYDLRAEMRDAYRVLYDYELTDEDIDGILWIAQQGDAAGYERFHAE